MIIPCIKRWAVPPTYQSRGVRPRWEAELCAHAHATFFSHALPHNWLSESFLVAVNLAASGHHPLSLYNFNVSVNRENEL